MDEYKGYRTKIHCPDCQMGTLRVLSSEELIEMFPTSRAAECVRHPEELKTQYWMHPRTFEMHERWGKPKRVGLFCDKCNHFHDADERSVKRTFKDDDTKPKSVNIKNYGKHFRRY